MRRLIRSRVIDLKSAVLAKPGELKIKDLERPEPGTGEVLIKVELAGICGSDYAVYKGKMNIPLPRISGHEAVGHIVLLGKDVKDLYIGQRVTIQPNFSCDICPVCKAGQENICPDKVRLGLDMDGVFSQYVKIPCKYAWPVPDSLDNETAVFTEPLAVACHALSKARPKPGQRVLVFGTGIIGLLVTQLAGLDGNDIFTFDPVRERLLVSENLGATGLMSIDDLVAKGPFDLIYETSGAPEALNQVIQLASPGASIVVLGLPESSFPLFSTPIVRKELIIFGSMIYTNEFPMALDLLENRKIITHTLVSGTYDLGRLSEALDDFRNPKRIKTLIRFDF